MTKENTKEDSNHELLHRLQMLVELGQNYAQEWTKQATKDPVFAVESSGTYIKHIIGGQEALLILKGYEKAQEHCSEDALDEVVQHYYDRYMTEILGDFHKACSTCAYHNAVADTRRAAILKVVELLNEYLKGKK